jgi:hypothetical protein
MDSYKLTAELIPEKAWYSNLRKQMTPSAWRKLGKEVKARQGQKCAVCNAEGRLECHEVWDYDDVNHFQRLAGFVCLCRPCHQVKHLGRTVILAQQGLLDFDDVIEHFLRINECALADFLIYQEAIRTQYQERSKHEWTTDLGEYADLVEPAAR